jgi:glycosyltransferase involved in cell wall biosynthesis
LFLGRIAVEKRPDWAVEIARRTGIKLKVAAKVDPYDQEYFDREIKHLFDDPLVEFIGEADEQEKRQLLAGAYGLMFPIDWPEPFGMVQIEALACGTPVLAMNRGSVPEVLRHGVSALVGNSVDELVALAPQLGQLDRRACRAEAERRFSSTAMAEGYEQVYRRVIANHQAEDVPLALRAPSKRMPMSA